MRLSIVVPVLNEEAAVEQALGLLQSLRARGHEVIVVDGGSVDATCALAVPLADRVLSTPPGRGLQMNAGALASNGEGLVFLHADTRLPDRADELILAALSRRTWGRFDVRIDSTRPMLALVGFMMNLRSRLSGIATGDQAIFVRREAFEATGGFRPIALMEDIALSASLNQTSRPACLDAKVVTSARRWERHGVVSTIFLMWRLRLMYFLGVNPDRLAQIYGSGR
jgi:rSAM/selenodomain-associated transferase 2